MLVGPSMGAMEIGCLSKICDESAGNESCEKREAPSFYIPYCQRLLSEEAARAFSSRSLLTKDIGLFPSLGSLLDDVVINFTQDYYCCVFCLIHCDFSLKVFIPSSQRMRTSYCGDCNRDHGFRYDSIEALSDRPVLSGSR